MTTAECCDCGQAVPVVPEQGRLVYEPHQKEVTDRYGDPEQVWCLGGHHAVPGIFASTITHSEES